MGLELLRKYLSDKGINLSGRQEEQFERFSTLLSERNKVMNLTAVHSGRDTEIRHFIDSLALITEMPGEALDMLSLHNANIIDLGTGAGFPGIPLAIMLPDAHFTLVDSLNKRISFLNEVTDELSLKNVRPVSGRFEELARRSELRESFDFGVSRAVAELRVLLEYSLPFIKGNGYFAGYKSGSPQSEIDAAEHALKELSAEVNSIYEYNEYDSEVARSIVLIHKISSNSDRYPRRNGIPLKRPL